MQEPGESYWQGRKPGTSDVDLVYGMKQFDEIFAGQLAYLPEGPLGTFWG